VKGGRRTRVVRGVDADGAEIDRLRGAAARVVGAVGRHHALQGEGRAVVAGGRAVVALRAAKGVPGRNGRVAILSVRAVQTGSDVFQEVAAGHVLRADDRQGGLAVVDGVGRSGRGGQGDGGDAGQQGSDLHDDFSKRGF